MKLLYYFVFAYGLVGELLGYIALEKCEKKWGKDSFFGMAALLFLHILIWPIMYPLTKNALRSKGGQPEPEAEPAQEPQHWMPTEEQMEALMLAIEGKCPPTSYLSRRLEELYEGLANTYNIDCE